MTIRDMGLPKALKERGTLEVLDRDEVTDREEVVKIYERAFTLDVYKNILMLMAVISMWIWFSTITS